MDYKTYHSDCFDILPKLDRRSVDLVVVDMPYGQTACEWDNKLDLDKMWAELKRACKKNCIYCFFCTTKFGYELISSNPTWFRYDLVWDKTNSTGWLNAKKAPLRTHEMIYIFSNKDDDLDVSHNLELRDYAGKIYKYTNSTMNEIEEQMGNRKAEHFFYRTNSTQFGIPTKETYKKLIELYKIDEAVDPETSESIFIPYDELRRLWDKDNKDTYNPQIGKGKPFKGKMHNGRCILYGVQKMHKSNNKGTRCPISILKFNHDKEKLHPTQKPVALCEWLVKTYSNKGDIVLDFCMGSGSTGLACKDRHFIGIEKDKKIYDSAIKRLSVDQKNE